jgi:flagellin
MAISVNNNGNGAALLALQDLLNNQNQVPQAQDAAGSAGAQDSAAIWSVGRNQQQQVVGLDAVTQSLNRATSISDVAMAAGQSVVNLLNQLKHDAVSASDASIDDSARQAYNSDFKTTLAQVASTVNSASFDNANLLDGSSSSSLSVLASADGGATLTLASKDLSLGGSVITLASTASISTVTAASDVLSQIDASLTNVTAALADLNVQADQISAHSSFVGLLSDTLQTGVGDMVNANMGAESARLQALQVQQQLGSQSLSVANQAPAVILSLFR